MKQQPRVLNMKTATAEEKAGAVYIGRPSDGRSGHYGNPFSHQQGTKAKVVVATREEAVKAFEDWITGRAWQHIEPERQRWFQDQLFEYGELYGRDLLCWCAPQACHGDVILRLAKPEAEDPKPYITVTKLGSGWAAIHLWWNTQEPDLAPFWEPYQTGLGRYATQELAEVEAREWAEAEELEYKAPQEDKS
jgi:hypothetical protein